MRIAYSTGVYLSVDAILAYIHTLPLNSHTVVFPIGSNAYVRTFVHIHSTPHTNMIIIYTNIIHNTFTHAVAILVLNTTRLISEYNKHIYTTLVLGHRKFTMINLSSEVHRISRGSYDISYDAH